MQVELTPQQRALIEEKIAGYAAGDSLDDRRRACSRAHALPIFLDWSGWMAIRPDGMVIWIDDDREQVRIVDDERVRNLGLFQGSRSDPGLGFLAPVRPPDASECPHCHGTGVPVLPKGYERLSGKLGCFCGGLGWLPARSPGSGSRAKRFYRKLRLMLP